MNLIDFFFKPKNPDYPKVMWEPLVLAFFPTLSGIVMAIGVANGFYDIFILGCVMLGISVLFLFTA